MRRACEDNSLFMQGVFPSTGEKAGIGAINGKQNRGEVNMGNMVKNEAGKFKPGQSGNPAGRPKGTVSGRSKALNAVDQIAGKEENLALLEAALEEALRNKPLWFFVNIIMPLLPKESKGVLEGEKQVVEWRSLLSVCDAAREEGADAGAVAAGEGGREGVITRL